ncbi:hypothetical protein [Micromonospora cremea]|nr:hypothetical protein [Micromonospora cremea]
MSRVAEQAPAWPGRPSRRQPVGDIQPPPTPIGTPFVEVHANGKWWTTSTMIKLLWIQNNEVNVLRLFGVDELIEITWMG